MFLAVLGAMALPPDPAASRAPVPQDDYAMSPTSGPRGTQVEVTGTVADSNPVWVFWDADVIVSCDPAPARCRDPRNQDPQGFRVRFTVPTDATIGDHRVSLCASGFCEGFDDAWTFTVEQTTAPDIESVGPTPIAPGRAVVVRGRTGSCNRQGTLTVPELPGSSMPVTGDQDGSFEVTFTVPRATFPKAYKLLLSVDCHGDPQQDTAELRVENHAPKAAGDTATTARNTPLLVDVTANDADPDGDDGYPQVVFEQGPPTHGTTEARPDGTIVYTPDPGFAGQDQFTYSNCDVLAPRNAAGRWDLDCGTATVTVTVDPDGATTTSTPPTSTPPTSTPPTSTPPASTPPASTPPTSTPPTSTPPTSTPPTSTPPTSTPSPTSTPPTSSTGDCAPSAEDIRSFRVDPVKGARGATLRITGKADQRLAACPLMLLLGGSRIGGALTVSPSGGISERLSVPKDANPGTSTVTLAATSGQILAEAPFEILPLQAAGSVKRWWPRDVLRLLVAGAALGVGALARVAFRRWQRTRHERPRRPPGPAPRGVRVEPRASPVRVTMQQDAKGPPSCTMQLRPHHDTGTQILAEVPR